MATRKGFIHDLVRGWDTAIHTGRMLLFSLLWVGVAAGAVLVLIAGTYSYHFSTPEQRQISHLWLRGTFWHLLSMDRRAIQSEIAGKSISLPAGQVWRAEEIRQTAAAMGAVTVRGLLLGSATSGVLVLGVVIFAYRRGRQMRQDELIRGGELVEAAELAGRLQQVDMASDVTFGSVPMLRGSEPQHTLIAGAPGTGKSVLISGILDRIRARGERAIIYDSSGDFLSQFWREGDSLLNPLDARSASWTPWAELRAPYDADRLAEALIPAEAKNDPFWVLAARQIFAGALNRLPVRDVSGLLDHVLTSDLSSLASVVAGTDAATILAEGNEKMALSVLATLATYVRSLRFLRAGEIAEPFSVRSWIEQESSSWLFVSSRADQHTSLRPLITAWLDSAASAVMSLPPSRSRRIWFILDELPSLQRMPSVPQLLGMGRKYGACGVLGFQSISQLREIYGRDGAEALAGMASTWAVFRSPDPDTADWASRALGESDLDENQESISYSAEESRDGVSLRSQRQTRRVVMPTEIMSLRDLHAYLRLPGAHPITRIPLAPVSRPQVAAAYEEADLSQTVWGCLPPVVTATEKPKTKGKGPVQDENQTQDAADADAELILGSALDFGDDGGRGWH